MKLSDVRIPSEDIPFPGDDKQCLTVRGLNFTDIDLLWSLYQEPIEDVFNRFLEGQTADIPTIVRSVVKDAPALAASIIATANDEPEQVKKALMLPLIVQVDALVKIATMTVSSAAAVKKIVDNLDIGMEQTKSTLETLSRRGKRGRPAKVVQPNVSPISPSGTGSIATT